jgi:hypothetical protein
MRPRVQTPVPPKFIIKIIKTVVEAGLQTKYF